VKLLRRPFHSFVKSLFVVSRTSFFRAFNHDARSIRQHPQCFRKPNAFFLHDEAEDVSANVANPTFPCLAVWIDLQTGATVIMKWARRDKASPLPTNFAITADQIDNIDRQANSIFDFVVNSEGH
jgi:hypothetical protein